MRDKSKSQTAEKPKSPPVKKHAAPRKKATLRDAELAFVWNAVALESSSPVSAGATSLESNTQKTDRSTSSFANTPLRT